MAVSKSLYFWLLDKSEKPKMPGCKFLTDAIVRKCCSSATIGSVGREAIVMIAVPPCHCSGSSPSHAAVTTFHDEGAGLLADDHDDAWFSIIDGSIIDGPTTR
jgi:hypothetical protein